MDDVAHVLEGWSRGELHVKRCYGCEALQFPPRAVCLLCHAESLTWTTVPLRGTIASFTVVHRAPTLDWKTRVPYAIALVDLAPGVRMMMNVVGDFERASIGAAVEIAFTTTSDAQRRPEARLVDPVRS